MSPKKPGNEVSPENIASPKSLILWGFSRVLRGVKADRSYAWTYWRWVQSGPANSPQGTGSGDRSLFYCNALLGHHRSLHLDEKTLSAKLLVLYLGRPFSSVGLIEAL